MKTYDCQTYDIVQSSNQLYKHYHVLSSENEKERGVLEFVALLVNSLIDIRFLWIIFIFVLFFFLAKAE